VRVAQPKKVETWVFNGQPDPVGGGVASCISGAPALPNGLAVGVLCHRYEQSTTDETGSLGFTAAPTGTRKWSYEYNQYGQVTKETDPRLKQTTYEYYDTTAFNGDGAEHTLGDLKLMRNALGQTTQYLDYNKRGQVRRIQHPNGSVEQRQYHERGWLTHVTLTPAGGGVPELTQYDYYPTGLLKQVTQPDGNYAIYTWDAAHRLIGVEDKLQNRVTYVLDNAGNREREEYWDPNDVLKKTITRTFDALGRMDSSTGLLH
jgi:YD repeat-containing protein